MHRSSHSLLAIALAALCLSTSALAYPGGTGEPNDPYQIADANDWQEFMVASSDWGKSFVLTADIDLHSVAVYGIANFYGSFDGCGHVVRNLTMSGSSGKDGLFSYIGDGGQVRGLGVEDANIVCDQPLGILCALNYGTITGCHSTGTARYIGPTNVTIQDTGGLCSTNSGTIADSWSTATVTGYRNVGGLCGNNGGTITGCYASGIAIGYEDVGGLCGVNYATIKSCHAVCTVAGSLGIGGLCGAIRYGTISDSFTAGSVTGDSSSYDVGGLSGVNLYGTITRCYASATVTGRGRVGGLCGKPMYGSIKDSYAVGSVTGSSQVGGLCGYIGDAIIRCYAAGSVTGDEYVGGLIGYRDGTVIDSFWDANTTGKPNAVGWGSSSGIFGRSHAEMMERSTFAAHSWDFLGETANGTNDYWRMCVDGIDYPHLTWEYVQAGGFACPDGIAFDDLARLTGDWLTIYPSPMYGADANGDSVVSFMDFAVLAASWLN